MAFLKAVLYINTTMEILLYVLEKGNWAMDYTSKIE
jgi:hypothetical protein